MGLGTHLDGWGPVSGDLGEIIHEACDAEGLVHVYQRAGLRYLTFGNQVEQSCLNTARPHSPEHVYIQAMVLAAVFAPQARRALVLGLGGGSLVRALRAARPALMVDAVERRQVVVDVAASHFGVVAGRRLRIHCNEAADYMAASAQRYALVFADLYLAEGMHPSQVDRDFLAACSMSLDPNGLFVANHWCSEFRDSLRVREMLQELYGGRVLYLHVQGGNVIAFCFKAQPPELDRRTWYAQAQTLGQYLEIPLQRHARNFWRQNSENYMRIRRTSGSMEGSPMLP